MAYIVLDTEGSRSAREQVGREQLVTDRTWLQVELVEDNGRGSNMLTKRKVSDTSQEEKQRVYVSWRRLIALCPGKLGRHEYRLVRVIRTGMVAVSLGHNAAKLRTPDQIGRAHV